MSGKKIRYPAVTGSFYPSDKKELKELLGNFFAKAKKFPLIKKPRILIVPHAGIVFSGQTAAWGFKQLENQDFKKIILIGASHHYWFDYAALSSADFWQTPLGEIKVDKENAEKLVNQKIIFDENPHLKEHCLELELIFLQKIIPDFKIIPILVSQPDEELIKKLAKKISLIFDEKTLIVVSTDLSHYPPADIAREVDEKTMKAILSGKRQIFEKEVKKIEKVNYPGVETAICGFQAVRVGLELGEILKVSWQKLFYQNSGEIFQDKQAVVGYGAVVGISKNV